MLKKACWLAQLTYSHSILTRGYSCPLKPQQGIRKLIYFFTGGSRHLLLGSPAGRCGLIGLSHFLQFASYLAFAVFLPVVSPFTHTATPTRARAVIPSIVTFHSAPFSLGSICFFLPQSLRLQQCFAALHTASPPRTKAANRSFASFHFTFSVIPALAFPPHAQSKKSASPAEIGSRPPPSFFGLPAASALAPLAVGSRLSTSQAKTIPLYLHLFFPASFRLKAALPVFGLNPASPSPAPDHPPQTKTFF